MTLLKDVELRAKFFLITIYNHTHDSESSLSISTGFEGSDVHLGVYTASADACGTFRKRGHTRDIQAPPNECIRKQ